MSAQPDTERRAFLKLSVCVAAQFPLGWSASAADVASPHSLIHIRDDLIDISVDAHMRTSVHCLVDGRRVALTQAGFSEYVMQDNNQPIQEFVRTGVQIREVNGLHGPGLCTEVSGLSRENLQKTVRYTQYRRYPGFVQVNTEFCNRSKQALTLSTWFGAASQVVPDHSGKPGYWCYAGASYPDRRDWVQPVHSGFSQTNFLGMNASDYGGGTPIVDIWRRDCGLAIGHLETVPKLVALPVHANGSTVQIAMSGVAGQLAPDALLQPPTTFIAVHRGDYFHTLDTYRQVMAELGLKAPSAPSTSYEAIWCAWGYERAFSMDLVAGTLPKVRELGFKWAVIDDGWQTANGDWYVNRNKFPRGAEDLKGLAQQIRAAGLKPRLWFSPLAVGPGTDLLHDHTDMLLLDKDGAVQNISWWNCFYLCPAYQPTIDATKQLVRTMLKDWGFAGLKIDGQHLNGVAPCYNPAHRHARPEESVEKLQDFFRAIYDTAMEISAESVVEICPCGTSYAFHNMPYMNQAPASDPLSSWQVRHKGKTLKALMGPSAPFAGDHVELSDGGNDFASALGIGAVLSTKFTWPVDPKPQDSFLLTPDKEQVWRKYIDLYQALQLATGQYRGELYDIGFDVPETHAIEKDGRMYYALYAKAWHGTVSLRGLPPGNFLVRDYVNGIEVGQVSHQNPQLQVRFEHALLLEAVPVTATPEQHALWHGPDGYTV